MSVDAATSSAPYIPYFHSADAPPPDWDELLPNYLQLGVECSLNPDDTNYELTLKNNLGPFET